jgi:hypothetical protein
MGAVDWRRVLFYLGSRISADLLRRTTGGVVRRDGGSMPALVVAHGHGVVDDMEKVAANLLKRQAMAYFRRGTPLPYHAWRRCVVIGANFEARMSSEVESIDVCQRLRPLVLRPSEGELPAHRGQHYVDP